MQYRLYYRYIGAPIDRPGGAWWYRDFLSNDERRFYVSDMAPHVAEFWYLTTADDLPLHVSMGIAPPIGHPGLSKRENIAL